MLGLTWLRGLIAHRRARLFGAVAGIAIAVSLVAAIGTFLSGSTAAMTDRAIAGVPLDWQVQTRSGVQPASILRAVADYPSVRTALPVAYFSTSGFAATTGNASGSASAGLVVGIPRGYRQRFPGVLRQYVGSRTGVLVAQQMAANLGIGVGGTVTVPRPGLRPLRLKVDGLIDFTTPTQLLNPVAPATSTTAAPPPDNVMLVPLRLWHAAFDPVIRSHPGLARYQVHAELDHRVLPRDPTAAFSAAQGLARNLEVRLQGQARVGNDLAAALDAARSDSLYARVAFLFLGLPGALLATLLTITLASAGSDRRRREQALLRARGATTSALMRIALAETFFVGLAGGAVGLGAALMIGRAAFGSASFGAGTRSAVVWALASLAGGLAVAGIAIAVPALRDARDLTVSAARIARPPRAPWWARFYIDVLALTSAVAAFWVAGRSGYHLVLATEGVSQVSVDYWAFVSPLLAWIGIGLLSYRLADLLLRRGRSLVASAARPIAGDLAGTVA